MRATRYSLLVEGTKKHICRLFSGGKNDSKYDAAKIRKFFELLSSWRGWCQVDDGDDDDTSHATRRGSQLHPVHAFSETRRG